jgi:hypothetical protein
MKSYPYSKAIIAISIFSLAFLVSCSSSTKGNGSNVTHDEKKANLAVSPGTAERGIVRAKSPEVERSIPVNKNVRLDNSIDEKSSAKPNSAQFVVDSNDGEANLRPSASTQDRSIGVLKNGEAVTVTGETINSSGQKWFSVESTLGKGWVYSELLVDRGQVMIAKDSLPDKSTVTNETNFNVQSSSPQSSSESDLDRKQVVHQLDAEEQKSAKNFPIDDPCLAVVNASIGGVETRTNQITGELKNLCDKNISFVNVQFKFSPQKHPNKVHDTQSIVMTDLAPNESRTWRMYLNIDVIDENFNYQAIGSSSSH